MRAVLIVVLLLLSTSSARAEWVKVSEAGGTQAADIYLDPATIRINGEKRKVWSLWDFKVEQKSGAKKYRSALEQREYDCREEQTRMTSFIWYAGQMGSGSVIHSESSLTRWEPVVPGSIGETSLNILCKP
ncbi:MAG: hypothetical protein U1F33_01400 [Alphaproteobacteria bacterium]